MVGAAAWRGVHQGGAQEPDARLHAGAWLEPCVRAAAMRIRVLWVVCAIAYSEWGRRYAMQEVQPAFAGLADDVLARPDAWRVWITCADPHRAA